MENVFRHADQDQASSQVIDNSLHGFGLSDLTGGKLAFINATREVLLHDYALLLPAEQTVVEILETVEPDDEVVAAARRLKDSGYTVALDDFEYSEKYEPLLDLADIVKVDFMLTSSEIDRQLLTARVRRPGVRLLAEKVETHEDFKQGVELGYDYFQGYFFCKPEVVSRRSIPSNKLNNLRFIQTINRPDFDIDTLEDLIKHDVGLSYKLLRYLNSAAFGWKEEITSIRHAIMMMGQRPMIKWATLVGLAAMADDKPQELIMASLVRARFGELLGQKIGGQDTSFDLFLTGMFSLIDALTDRSLDEALGELQIRPEITDTLLNRQDGELANSLDLILAQEKGDWSGVTDAANRLEVDESLVPDLYAQSVTWAEEIFSI